MSATRWFMRVLQWISFRDASSVIAILQKLAETACCRFFVFVFSQKKKKKAPHTHATFFPR